MKSVLLSGSTGIKTSVGTGGGVREAGRPVALGWLFRNPGPYRQAEWNGGRDVGLFFTVCSSFASLLLATDILWPSS